MASQGVTVASAPVHEYDVMWTAQVTQKLKRWNDGTLKLHTFNKRAMLYDTAKMLVVRAGPAGLTPGQQVHQPDGGRARRDTDVRQVPDYD
ncbi:uncharacterized protein V1510DRAFT_412628 [Dipodascopsis tothii]|uniref:uncharacterized protein n=1 Tax=Dipodascopsis tothii TaxID=44089 RepID=UPI0034CDE449